MAKTKTVPLSKMSSAQRAKRVAELVKNPGTRSAVPTQYLPPELRRKRELNTRLNAPVAPGSSTTQRDVARAANAQTTVRYAPQEQALGAELGHAQGVARDTPAWWDSYLAERAQHAQNVTGFSTDANTAAANLQAGTKGLDQAALDAQRTQANASAAPRGATPADLGPEASQAAAVRQAILAAVGSQVADAGRGANTYADTLAHVVAPMEKLSALTQAAGKVGEVKAKQTALKSEEGAYNTSVRQQSIADEFKNALAAQVAGVNTAKTKADTAATTTKTSKTAADIAYFKKHGYYPRTGPAPAPKAPDQMTGPGAKYGYTRDEWAKLSVPQRQKIIKDFKSTGKKKDGGKGPDWQTPAQQGTGLAQLGPLKAYAAKAKSGEAFVAGHPKQKPLTRAQAVAKITASVAAPKHPVLLSAALDAAYDGHLSAETVQRLIDAGYKPSAVAQTLGVPTSGQWRKGRGSSTYVRPPKTSTTGSRGDG